MILEKWYLKCYGSKAKYEVSYGNNLLKGLSEIIIRSKLSFTCVLIMVVYIKLVSVEWFSNWLLVMFKSKGDFDGYSGPNVHWPLLRHIGNFLYHHGMPFSCQPSGYILLLWGGLNMVICVLLRFDIGFLGRRILDRL